METNFFQQIAALNVDATWKIVVTKGTDNILIVQVLLTPPANCGNSAKIIQPMIFKELPEILDKGFFNSITAPAEVTSQIFTNMAAVAKSQDEALKAVKKEHGKKEGSIPVIDEKTRKFEAQMQKVSQLEDQQKYGEAIAQLPKPEDYPSHEDELAERSAALWEKRNKKENTLF